MKSASDELVANAAVGGVLLEMLHPDSRQAFEFVNDIWFPVIEEALDSGDDDALCDRLAKAAAQMDDSLVTVERPGSAHHLASVPGFNVVATRQSKGEAGVESIDQYMQQLLKSAADSRASGVWTLDVRSASISWSRAWCRAIEMCTPVTLELPGYWSRLHNGPPSARADSSGGFGSGVVYSGARHVTPQLTPLGLPARIKILGDSRSGLAGRTALALESAGLATVEGSAAQAGSSINLRLSANLAMKIRTSAIDTSETEFAVGAPATAPTGTGAVPLSAVARAWAALRFFFYELDGDQAVQESRKRLISAIGSWRIATSSCDRMRSVGAVIGATGDGHIRFRGHVPDAIVGTSHAVIRPYPSERDWLIDGRQIETIDGVPLSKRLMDLRAVHPLPQPGWIADHLLAGPPDQPAVVSLSSEHQELEKVEIPRRRRTSTVGQQHRSPICSTGPVTAIDMAMVEPETVDTVVKAAKEAQGVILDCRGYPGSAIWKFLHSVCPRTHVGDNRRIEIRGDTPPLCRVVQVPRWIGDPSNPPWTRPTAIVISNTTISRGEFLVAALIQALKGRTFGQVTHGTVGDVSTVRIGCSLTLEMSGQEFVSSALPRIRCNGISPDDPVNSNDTAADTTLGAAREWVLSELSHI